MAALDRSFFEALDQADPLSSFRARFDLPGDRVFLNGNSLGAPPKSTWNRLSRLVGQDWRDDMNSGWWKHGWLDLPRTVGDRIGRLVGAGPGQVVVGESTSVNLFKLLCGALRSSTRRTVLTDSGNFPSDLYIADGIAAHVHPDARVRRVPAPDLLDALDDDVAVVMLSHADYRTAEILPMKEINERAHAAGALVLWDLSHSAGVLPLALDADGADLAVGCGYKYLNGGPGAPGYMYVASRLLPGFEQPITGWLGHADPFTFEAEYRPDPGVGRLTTGCPPLLSLVALDEGVALAGEADPGMVRAKSTALTGWLIELTTGRLGPLSVEVPTPADPARRGGHVALRHPAAERLARGLAAHGIAVEFRSPELLRLAPSPLFNRYVDVWDAVAVLERLLTSEHRSLTYGVAGG
ncbi:kynureninase [Microbispora triticiradicis]|uniref:Kynureninase n=1 Tax=Microbispora triticiradicis TaxID=2200763 RepID=A0ABX9LLD0_9ACTN|nr:kynureninase [Microbispora triticiradicis]RGA04730.1 kynureninase [Microbispora triticiradicis]GLW20621.1 kynureninase [Microbispora amethystogenes]